MTSHVCSQHGYHCGRKCPGCRVRLPVKTPRKPRQEPNPATPRQQVLRAARRREVKRAGLNAFRDMLGDV